MFSRGERKKERNRKKAEGLPKTALFQKSAFLRPSSFGKGRPDIQVITSLPLFEQNPYH